MAEQRLDALIERHMLAPFVWGRNDCCLAVCNVLRDAGFGDPAGAYRGLYSDRDGAYAIMGGTVEQTAERLCKRLSWREIPQSEVRDGDIGVHGHSLAIFCSGWWWIKADETGCGLKRRVRRAWRPK